MSAFVLNIQNPRTVPGEKCEKRCRVGEADFKRNDHSRILCGKSQKQSRANERKKGLYEIRLCAADSFFRKKVKIKVGGGTMRKTKRGARKKPEKSRKKEQKSVVEKQNPSELSEGNCLRFFSYLRSCGSLSSIGNAGSSVVGGLVVLFAAGSEAKNSHKSCECKCDVLFHFVFPPNENIEYVCVFFLAEPCSAAYGHSRRFSLSTRQIIAFWRKKVKSNFVKGQKVVQNNNARRYDFD